MLVGRVTFMSGRDEPTEPSPFYDPGPYESAEQARAQVAASTHGIPATQVAPAFAGELVLMEALLRAGVRVSPWEGSVRDEIIRTMGPAAAQVIAGWLIRAHLAGAIGPAASLAQP